jgi:hypothetical protein
LEAPDLIPRGLFGFMDDGRWTRYPILYLKTVSGANRAHPANRKINNLPVFNTRLTSDPLLQHHEIQQVIVIWARHDLTCPALY